MTTTEFSNQFDISYNAISSMSAPGLDEYEKSVYLTKAQLEIIKNYDDPVSNRKGRGFEGSDKRRTDLSELIKTYSSSQQVLPVAEIKINENSVFYRLPEDCFLIKHESVKLKKNGVCNEESVTVRPFKYDHYNTQIKNPFKKPSDKLVWRLDLGSVAHTIGGGSGVTIGKVVELIGEGDIEEYYMRYLRYPNPIILTDLNVIDPTLSIEGFTDETPCELHPEIHPEILNRAVELAFGDYKRQALEAKIQLSSRNE